MEGLTDLAQLLAGMSPQLCDEQFVFCTFPGSAYGDHAELKPVAAFLEEEGMSLVVPRARADAAGLDYDCLFCAITLSVHSSLEAVGLTAAVAGALAEEGISANVAAAYYHDHLFVPVDDAQQAMQILNELSAKPLTDDGPV